MWMCVCVACSLAHSYVRYFEFIVFNSFWVSLVCCCFFFSFFVNNNENTLKHASETEREREHITQRACTRAFKAFCKCIRYICMCVCVCAYFSLFCCFDVGRERSKNLKGEEKNGIHTARKHFGRITFWTQTQIERIIESVIEFLLFEQQHSPCFCFTHAHTHAWIT